MEWNSLQLNTYKEKRYFHNLIHFPHMSKKFTFFHFLEIYYPIFKCNIFCDMLKVVHIMKTLNIIVIGQISHIRTVLSRVGLN